MIWKRRSFIVFPERAELPIWGGWAGRREKGTDPTGPGPVPSSVFRMWSTCSCKYSPLQFIMDKFPVSLNSSTSLMRSRTVSSGWTPTPAEVSSCQVRPPFPGSRLLVWGLLYPDCLFFSSKLFWFLSVCCLIETSKSPVGEPSVLKV